MSTDDRVIQWLIDIAPTAIACFIIFFNLVGHFGNINFICVTVRKKNLQSKHGILLTVVCAEHSMCLLGELVNAYFAISGKAISRKTCLILMTPYIFIDCCQSMMFLLISMDVLASIVIPMHYKQWNNFTYCFILSCIPLVFPAVLFSYAYSHLTEEQIFLCNPPLALAEEGTIILGGVMVVVNFITLLIYGYIYFLVYVQRKKNVQMQTISSTDNSPEKKVSNHQNLKKKELQVMRSLSILVIVFCFSWVFCMGSVFFVKFVVADPLVVTLVQCYVVLFALIAFSQTFYVCYVRSEMYRSEFQRQMCKKTPEQSKELLSRMQSKSVRITTM